MKPPLQPERLLRPGEVAALFGVKTPTLARYVDAGQLHPVPTPGVHARYRESEVLALFADCGGDDAAAAAILGGAQ